MGVVIFTSEHFGRPYRLALPGKQLTGAKDVNYTTDPDKDTNDPDKDTTDAHLFSFSGNFEDGIRSFQADTTGDDATAGNKKITCSLLSGLRFMLILS